MWAKVKNYIYNISKNFHYYLPGLMFILLGFMILLLPYLLVFIVSMILFSVGALYISAINFALKEQREVKLFSNVVRDHFNRWHSYWY